MTTVCTFGFETPDATRSWVLREGLRANGINVMECRTEKRGAFAKFNHLRKQMRSINCDAILVTFPGHYLVLLAWMIARRKKVPLIFDAFISLYDTMVMDREVVSPYSPRAWMLRFADWLSCKLADLVLIDTPEHAEYFKKSIGVKDAKILALPVGYRTDLFQASPVPKRNAGDPLLVHFHGTFIPLQGIRTIVHAMHILHEKKSNVRLTIVGGGQTYSAMRQLAEELATENTTFHDFVPLGSLAAMIAASHVGLGIFGTTDKALRVIPHKAYEVLASGRPLITADTPASRRLLEYEKTAILVKPGNAEKLADALERLEKDPGFCEKLGSAGAELTQSTLQPAMIVKPLVQWLTLRAS